MAYAEANIIYGRSFHESDIDIHALSQASGIPIQQFGYARYLDWDAFEQKYGLNVSHSHDDSHTVWAGIVIGSVGEADDSIDPGIFRLSDQQKAEAKKELAKIPANLDQFFKPLGFRLAWYGM